MRYFALISVAALMFASPVNAQMGHVLNGVGPVDQGMSGAGMAAPRDALSALHWNPGSITTLEGTSFDIGLQFLMPTGSIGSTVDPGAFGELPNFMDPEGPATVPFPWASLSGVTDSEAGPFPIPSLGFVRATPGSRWAYGFSAFGVGGFGVEYAESPMPMGSLADNPIVSPQQGDMGMGFGALSSEFALMQISPTIAYRLTEAISLGFAPTINFAALELSVFPATQPYMNNTPLGPLPMYPDAPRDWARGFGWQAGMHADVGSFWSLGISFKSPQRFEEFEFAPTEGPGDLYTFRLDYPAVFSMSGALRPGANWLVAADARYIDFGNTRGFEHTGFGPGGVVQGFGWESIGSLALGAEWSGSSVVTLRAGYAYNENPIPSDGVFFNAPAPAIVQHHISGGATLRLTDRITASVALQYGLSNEVSGTWMTMSPLDGSTVPIQGTTVTSELSTFTSVMGVHFAW